VGLLGRSVVAIAVLLLVVIIVWQFASAPPLP
jgi:hypothetical protein